MNTIIVCNIVIVIICLFCFIVIKISNSQFKRSSNPYCRYCTHCGQRQEFFTYDIREWEHGWWEDAGEIKDDTCICHSYQEYRS